MYISTLLQGPGGGGGQLELTVMVIVHLVQVLGGGGGGGGGGQSPPCPLLNCDSYKHSYIALDLAMFPCLCFRPPPEEEYEPMCSSHTPKLEEAHYCGVSIQVLSPREQDCW